MNRIKKALQKWVYGEEIEDPFRAQIGKMLPLYEPPRYGINGFTHNGRIASTELIKKQEEEKMKMKWKCFNCNKIVKQTANDGWPDGRRCPFCGGGPIYAIQKIAEVEEPSALKLINRVSENGSLVSEHLSIEPPMELTIQWDTKVYGMVSLKPGELLLKRRVEEAEES